MYLKTALQVSDNFSGRGREHVAFSAQFHNYIDDTEINIRRSGDQEL